MNLFKERMKNSGYMPAKDVAKKLGVSIHTVYGWIRGNKVIADKSLGIWYVKVDSLIETIGRSGAISAGFIVDDSDT